ncbi:MAG: hypothetical protein D6768_07825 [Chloroflexi bacterium]|nr:MAG: hypothetical protein D6768_07825 [Chloroflexota bacterium]
MATKLDYVQAKKLNPADELRATLSILEDRQPMLKSLSAGDALALLQEMDAAHALFAQLEAAGVDLSSEQGRFDSIQGKVRKRAGAILRAIGGPAALAEHRRAAQPTNEQWWWFLQALVAARKQKIVRQLLITGAVVLAVLGGLYVAFQTVLAPSPEAVARLDAENQAMAAFDQGNVAQALAEVNEGLEVVPNDSGLLLMAAVFHEMLGQNDIAGELFAQARAASENEEFYRLGRAQVYLRTGQAAKVEAEARAALEANPQSARAALMLGQSLEVQGLRQEAAQAYEQASELAQATNENEVFVMARLALGRLMGGVTGP